MLDWHYKAKGKISNKMDRDLVKVSIYQSKSRNRDLSGKTLSCKFNKELSNGITTTGYIVFAIDLSNKRLYFKESNAMTGFKLYSIAKSSNYVEFKCSISEMDAKNIEKYSGYYSLKYDENEKLHYVSFDEAKLY